MRGKRTRPDSHLIQRRLIPAHAGKTPHVRGSARLWGAHPRACGENARQPVRPCLQTGSSPRMRGKQALPVRARQATGLIPAHAGKTMAGSDLAAWRRAHPRACGENFSCDARTCVQAGSSPRMRGKRFSVPVSINANGLIPAHAGKTRSAAQRANRCPAHPRACGENPEFGEPTNCHRGSSPRMRGKPPLGAFGGVAPRLIPAHAGKTSRHWIRPGG